MPPLAVVFIDVPVPIRGIPFTPPVTLIGPKFGRNGYFFCNVSARCKISRIYSDESIEAMGAVFFEAVVDKVVFDPP